MKILRRLKYWMDRSKRIKSLNEEMQSHVAFRVDELVEEGYSRLEAISRARREFGNQTQISEDSRAIWIARYATDLVQDHRYAIRNLMRQPGFAAAGILSAALGIALSLVPM